MLAVPEAEQWQWPRAVSQSGAVPVTGTAPDRDTALGHCCDRLSQQTIGRTHSGEDKDVSSTTPAAIQDAWHTLPRQLSDSCAARLHWWQRFRGESLGQQLLCSKQREIRVEGINYLRGIVLYDKVNAPPPQATNGEISLQWMSLLLERRWVGMW